MQRSGTQEEEHKTTKPLRGDTIIARVRKPLEQSKEQDMPPPDVATRDSSPLDLRDWLIYRDTFYVIFFKNVSRGLQTTACCLLVMRLNFLLIPWREGAVFPFTCPDAKASGERLIHIIPVPSSVV